MGRFDDLFESERAAVEGAIESRQREFASGRMHAREGLRQIGLAEVAIPAAADRAPVWPRGTVGSITHVKGYCAAAVASDHAFTAIGIDAEIDRPLPEELQAEVLTPRERDLLPVGKDNWDIATFSAKEALFKAWAPLTEVWLGFDQAEIEFQADLGSFTARLTPEVARTAAKAGLPSRLSGKFVFGASLVLTSVCLAQSEAR